MTSPSISLSPRSIVFWRHVVGITVVLMAQHPRLYETGMMFLGLWLSTVAIALGGAALVTGLAYLFFTAKTKGRAWRLFIVVAWGIAIFQLFGEWLLPTIVSNVATTSSSVMSTVSPKPGLKPSYDTEGWTQESTGSTEAGPWLSYSPPGTRYCRYADRTIVRLYPPGVMPNAEKANPFCLGDSTEYVPK